MPRRRSGNQLVPNEMRVLMAALRLLLHDLNERIWVGDIPTGLVALGEPLVHDATANRALNRFVARGWMEAAWETEDATNHSSSRPRLYYRITKAGTSAAADLLIAARRDQPPWLMQPELVGLDLPASAESNASRRTQRTGKGTAPMRRKAQAKSTRGKGLAVVAQSRAGEGSPAGAPRSKQTTAKEASAGAGV